MIKLTVQQYANKCNTSVQQIYRQINKGSLTSVKENARTLVVIEDEDVKQSINNVNNKVKLTLEQYLTKENKRLNKEIKRLNNIIEKLNKKLDKSNKSEKQTLINYISELKQLQLEYKPKEDVETIKIKNKKKKSKKVKK